MNFFHTTPWVLACCLSGAVSASNFESPGDAMSGFPEISGADSGESESSRSDLPDIEMEQYEIRLARPHAIGVGFGEVLPGLSASVVSTIVADNQSAFGLIMGTGKEKKREQIEGDYSFVNSFKTTVIGGRYIWWPSRNFPFSLELGLTGQKSTGSLSSGVSSSTAGWGTYAVYSAGAVGGLGLESFFENGVWLRWALIEVQLSRVMGGRYSGVSGAQMKSVRENIEGLKIIGLANLSLGYCW